MRWFIFLSIFMAQIDLASAQIRIISSEAQQGSMIFGQATAGTKVFLEGRQLKTDETGVFVFGVGRDSPSAVKLKVVSADKTSWHSIKVRQRQWKIERVDGLPPAKVNPRSKEVLARISAEAKRIRKARNVDSELLSFKRPFLLPAEGRISGVYGSQRVLNGEPKRPHYGLDVANKVGTPVIAPTDGVVTLVDNDMFYSGGTLILDHGFGISSTFIHLNSIDVVEGETVKQGQKIASIGATGRATGPHLDWRINWFQVRLDPGLLVEN